MIRWICRVSPLLLLSLVLAACGDSPTGEFPDVMSVQVTPAAGLVAGVGETLQFRAVALDAQGNDVGVLNWSIDDPSVAEISGTGLVTALSSGNTTIRANSYGTEGTATLEYYEAPEVPSYEPGQTYFGRRDYAEYQPGLLPIIISSPHGGEKSPGEIPDRTSGTTVTDRNTQDLARSIADALESATGERPHVVISRLMRTKLDPNREVGEAAQDSRAAEVAWAEYHGFIDEASAAIEGQNGPGLYLDLHGHGHDIDRVELGYLLSSSDLGQTDAVLNGQAFVSKSSIKVLADSVDLPFSQLVRGPMGFGSLLMAGGYRSVPSMLDPDPGGAAYFSGGYSTRRHGSRDGGFVSGIQLEHQFDGLRDTDANRTAYAAVLAEVILAYMTEHY